MTAKNGLRDGEDALPDQDQPSAAVSRRRIAPDGSEAATGARLSHSRIEFADASAFVSQHHRHHTPPTGHLFSLGAFDGDRLCGVAIVGRPVSRHRDDGLTAEITRLCTDGTRNAASFLLGRAARAAFALGFKKIGTYTLASEGGASLRAAGWRLISSAAGGGSWSRPSRARTDKHPTEQKTLWEQVA